MNVILMRLSRPPSLFFFLVRSVCAFSWLPTVETTAAQFPFLWRPLEDGTTLEGSKSRPNMWIACGCVSSCVLCAWHWPFIYLFFLFQLLFYFEQKWGDPCFFLGWWLCDYLCVCTRKRGGGNGLMMMITPSLFFFWVNFYSSLISRNGEKKRETSVSL